MLTVIAAVEEVGEPSSPLSHPRHGLLEAVVFARARASSEIVHKPYLPIPCIQPLTRPVGWPTYILPEQTAAKLVRGRPPFLASFDMACLMEQKSNTWTRVCISTRPSTLVSLPLCVSLPCVCISTLPSTLVSLPLTWPCFTTFDMTLFHYL